MISAAVPAEDDTWLIALADGVYRLNLETGEITLIAHKEEEAVAFGGENLDELYMTTARIGNDDEQLSKQPLAGAVFRVQLDVKGLPVQRARG